MNLSLFNFPFLIFILCMDQGQDLYSALDFLEKVSVMPVALKS